MTASKTSPAAAHASRRSGRAFSLVEVVMAATLLAVIASAVVGGIATVAAADARGQRKLESLELANRLLLQYLDDEKAMPQPGSHLEQGRGVYRWSLAHAPASLSMTPTSVVEIGSTQGDSAADSVELLVVNVYSGVPDGMGGYSQGERLCTLSRLVNPISAMLRNPDVSTRIFADMPGFMDRINRVLGPRAPRTGARATVASAFSGVRDKEGR